MTAEWTARDFIGGALCLDFANTLGGWHKEQSIERLDSYSSLLSWALAAGIVDRGEQAELFDLAAAQTEIADAELVRAKRLRAAIFSIFSAAAKTEKPLPLNVECLRTETAEAVGAASLGPDGGWKIHVRSVGITVIRRRIALAAFRLSDDAGTAALRECGRCSWLFLDRSKNKRRLWCDSTTCGNRARAERHYRRSRTGQTG